MFMSLMCPSDETIKPNGTVGITHSANVTVVVSSGVSAYEDNYTIKDIRKFNLA